MRNKLNFSTLSKVEEEFGNFEIGQTFGGGNPVYLRFGYWNRVDVNKLNEILNPINEVVEDEWYDDDCGWKYNYKLKQEVGLIKPKEEFKLSVRTLNLMVKMGHTNLKAVVKNLQKKSKKSTK